MGSEKKIAVFLIVVLLYSFVIWRNREKTPNIPENRRLKDMYEHSTSLPTKDVDRELQLTGWKGEKRQHVNLSMHIEDNVPGKKAENNSVTNEAKEVRQSDKKKSPETNRADTGKTKHSYRRYTTQLGDNLWAIVRRFYDSQTKSEINKLVKEVEAANVWLKNPDDLKTGEILRLPVLPGNRFDKKFQTLRQPLMNYESSTKHWVSAGQTLRKLAKRYYDDETLWYYIYDANKRKLKDPHILPCGIYIKIPRPLCQADH